LPTAAEVLVGTLAAQGVDRVYTVSGESYLGVLEALRREPRIDTLTCHHEGAAGFMAVADARLTGRLAVCMVSRGPGATNAAIGLHTAREDAVPMLLVVGQVARRLLRRDGFQEIDYTLGFGGVAKWAAEITDPARTAEIVGRAIHHACSGTPGPVIVSLPEDVQDGEAGDGPLPVFRRPRTAPDPDALAEVAARLARAERPLLLCGGELANDAGRAALAACARAWQAPVCVTFRRHDLYPNGDRLYAGDLGLQTTAAELAAWHDADLIVAIGTRLGDMTTKSYTFPVPPRPRQTFVHVHSDPEMIGRHFVPDIGLACDAVGFTARLAQARGDTPLADREAWTARLRALRAAPADRPHARHDDGVEFAHVIASLRPHLARDAIVVLDAGMASALAYRGFEWAPPQLLLAPITAGMGFGVPGAIAAALRFPGRQVVQISGDGGFLMTCAELALAAERRLPIRFIVANNRAYGVIRLHQENQYGPAAHVGTSLSTPDFALLARAYGLAAQTIADEVDIDPVLARLMSTDGPALVEVRASLAAQLPSRPGRT